jgi:hypothetical protein
MVIADLIEFPSQFVHYLARRINLNQMGNMYAHDELDWFGRYLSGGLNFDHLSGQPEAMFQLWPQTATIDAYYAYKHGNRKSPAPRPSMELAPLIRRIIDELETENAIGHSDAIYQLLELSPETQRKFSSAFDDRCRLVRKDGRPHDVSVIANDGKVGVTLLGTKSCDFEDNCQWLRKYVDNKVQSTTAESWLGLASIIGEPKLIHAWTVATRAPDRAS